MSVPIKIAVTKVKCLSDTDEVNSDEPYVLVTSVNLKSLVPGVEVTRYGPWDDVDDGVTRTTVPISPLFDPDPTNVFGLFRLPCWGINRKAAPINHPDDVIILVSLMENDDGDVNAMRTLVKGFAVASIGGSTTLSRASRVNKLKADINGALEIPTGAPNFDDPMGTQEFRLTKDLLNVNGAKKSKTLTFVRDGGLYEVHLEISKG